ncbi:divergent polysaccharide deacetylase family protein [Thermodesulfobacteriota bacterium]
MDRRSFLIKTSSFLAGALFGLQPFLKAFASESPRQGLSHFPPRIALIIDDIGSSCWRARMFLDLDAPITYAILPRLPNTHALASEIHKIGHEILLHQPMEPYNPEIDPGPGALYVGDRASRIFKVMEENISDIPHAVGVNNHMGSRFTSSQHEIQTALQVVKDKQLFFIDSLTTRRSAAYKTAKSLHVAAASRNIFLDNQPDERAILNQLLRLKRYALMFGRGIGIGHPFPETARAIGRFLEDHQDAGIDLVPVSRLVSPPAA